LDTSGARRLSASRMNEVTRILNAAERGDPQAARQLLPLVYDELCHLAAQKLAHGAPATPSRPPRTATGLSPAPGCGRSRPGASDSRLTCSPGAAPPARPRDAGGRSVRRRPVTGPRRGPARVAR